MIKKKTRTVGGEYSLAEGIAKVDAPLTNPSSFCFLTYNSITAVAPPPPQTAVFSKERRWGHRGEIATKFLKTVFLI